MKKIQKIALTTYLYYTNVSLEDECIALLNIVTYKVLYFNRCGRWKSMQAGEEKQLCLCYHN